MSLTGDLMQEPAANMMTSAESGQKRVLLQRLYPWIVWGLGATFFFYKYLLQVSPSVMSHDLMQAFNVTGAGLGNLAACYFYAYLIMQIPVGILLDKYSPRIVIPAAIGVCSLGALLFGYADSLIPAAISRAMIGLGAAFAAVSCFKLATIWFPPKRFALVAGLSMTAAMLGAVGGQAPLSMMVQHFGWRETMVYSAIPGFLLALLIIFMVRHNKTQVHISRHTEQTSILQQLKTILVDQQTWLLSLYSGLAFAPVSVFGGLWGVPFLETAYGLTANTAASAVSLIFIGFAIGCPLTGWFSDFVGRRKIIMLVGTIIALTTMTCVLYLPDASVWLLDILLFSFGLGASCFFLCFSMVREIHRLIFAATVLGFMNTFDSLCEAVSEPFIGKLLDLHWQGTMENGARVFSATDYHLALLVLPFYFLLGLLILFGIKETYCKQRY